MKIKFNKIKEKFNLEEIYVPDISVSKEEYVIDVENSSAGIYAFLGYSKHQKNIVLLGNMDSSFLEECSDEKIKNIAKSIMESNVKAIIVTSSLEDFRLINELKGKNIPILATDLIYSHFLSIFQPYILKKNTKRERVHATLMKIFGEGVLIMGKSGIGKSELSLDLIKEKHIFIGDDAIDVFASGGSLYGSAPWQTRDFLEVRGIGIVNVPKTYGTQSHAYETSISLVIELVELDNVKVDIERLGENTGIYEFQNGIKLPMMQIPVSSGRSLSSIVEAAVITHKNKKYNNYVAVKELNNNLKK